MRFSVGRLKIIEKIIRREKISMTRFDDLLGQLRKKEKMRYRQHRSIVREVFFFKILLLEKRNNSRGFELTTRRASLIPS
jgi:hypothetical protein